MTVMWLMGVNLKSVCTEELEKQEKFKKKLKKST